MMITKKMWVDASTRRSELHDDIFMNMREKMKAQSDDRYTIVIQIKRQIQSIHDLNKQGLFHSVY